VWAARLLVCGLSSSIDLLFRTSTCFSDLEKKKNFEGRNGGRPSWFLWTSCEANADDRLGPTYEYLSQREVGGNMVTIHFGHAIDFVQTGQFSVY
jgi:hypothetical protein